MRRFSVLLLLYVVCIGMFVTSSTVSESNPKDWFLWAQGIYHILAQVCLTNLIYIRVSGATQSEERSEAAYRSRPPLLSGVLLEPSLLCSAPLVPLLLCGVSLEPPLLCRAPLALPLLCSAPLAAPLTRSLRRPRWTRSFRSSKRLARLRPAVWRPLPSRGAGGRLIGRWGATDEELGGEAGGQPMTDSPNDRKLMLVTLH